MTFSNYSAQNDALFVDLLQNIFSLNSRAIDYITIDQQLTQRKQILVKVEK